MDKLLSAMVAACRDDGLDLICRVHMLEIIELRLADLRSGIFCFDAIRAICFYLAHMSRSMGWLTNENVTNYYKQKLAQIDTPPSRPQVYPLCISKCGLMHANAPNDTPLHTISWLMMII